MRPSRESQVGMPTASSVNTSAIAAAAAVGNHVSRDHSKAQSGAPLPRTQLETPVPTATMKPACSAATTSMPSRVERASGIGSAIHGMATIVPKRSSRSAAERCRQSGLHDCVTAPSVPSRCVQIGRPFASTGLNTAKNATIAIQTSARNAPRRLTTRPHASSQKPFASTAPMPRMRSMPVTASGMGFGLLEEAAMGGDQS